MLKGLFKGSADGITSMRRVLAFIFGLTSVTSGILSIIHECVWQIVLIAFSAPGLLSCLMMFFTTWDDVSKVVGIHKS